MSVDSPLSPATPRPAENAAGSPPAAPILQVQDLTKDFGGLRAVNHCSFAVQPGAVTGLIGPNGAGKTTLFNLITGFLNPGGGAIYFQGRRIDGLPPHEIARRGLLRTFQIPRELKRMTVLENLMVVPSGQTGENVWVSWLMPWRVRRQEQSIQRQALEVLDFLRLRPLANEYAGNLSTGQKKLLELARILMAQPAMALLDEPGAGVNPSLLNLLIDDIRRACIERKVTFLLIEHNMNLVMNLCDPVVVVQNGALLTQGAPDAVRSNPQVMQAYLGSRP